MSMSVEAESAALLAVLDRHRELAIAVSGGVDSMVLAFMSHRFSKARTMMLHAISPAVPAAATARIRRYAAREGWNVLWLNARELEDDNYRANPVNRCYYCKSNLYSRIREATFWQIASGTNLDDLGDFRPGLNAASEYAVVHPYVEAGLDKSAIYRMANLHGLSDLAELPAQPCLASRVETGIAINADDLAFIEIVETHVSSLVSAPTDIRCRTTSSGIVLEIGAAFPDERRTMLSRDVAQLCGKHGRIFAGVRDYRRGSAFIR